MAIDFQKKTTIDFQPIATKPLAEPNVAQKIWSGLADIGQGSANQLLAGGQKIYNSISGGLEQTRQGVQGGNMVQAFGGASKMALGSASGLVQSIFAPVTSVLQKTGQATDVHPLTELGKLPTMDGKSTVGVELKKVIEAHPEAAENIMDAVNVFGALYGAKFADPILNANLKKAPGVYKSAFSDIASQPGKLIDDLTAKSEAQINSAIIKNFEKGVKPLLPGKTTPTKLSKYRDDVVEGINTIKNNKKNLTYVDDGADQLIEPITGKSPETVQQFATAIEQTKKSIFAEYDGLAKQAGKDGLKIDTKPLASELDVVINNRALQLTNPGAITYARSLKDRFTKGLETLEPGGSAKTINTAIDAQTAQDVIQNFNKSLEAFYRNPNYDNASHAAIDAMLVNKLRQSLDDGITGLTGVEYQSLKNQYGSLKAIERDVTKAALRDARKNIKGLIDFTDIFSGGQVVNGILSLNPAQIASGLTQKALAEFYKYLNNPNRAIKAMFEAAEEVPGTSVIKEGVKDFIKNPKLGMSIEDVSKGLPKELKKTWYRGTDQVNKGSGDMFYSTSKEVAGDYGVVSKATNLPKKPLIVSDKQELADLIGYKKDPFTTLEIDKLAKEYAQSKGYDSILYRSGSLDAPELHVFGNNIKKLPVKDLDAIVPITVEKEFAVTRQNMVDFVDSAKGITKLPKEKLLELEADAARFAQDLGLNVGKTRASLVKAIEDYLNSL